jgi:hypothetical protein
MRSCPGVLDCEIRPEVLGQQSKQFTPGRQAIYEVSRDVQFSASNLLNRLRWTIITAGNSPFSVLTMIFRDGIANLL